MSKFVFNIIYSLFKRLTIKKKNIVFISHLGKSYSCNPRYLCEYLVSSHPNKYKLIWVYDRSLGLPIDLPNQVIPVPYFSYKYLYYICTTRFLVANTRLPEWYYFPNRKGQVYIQTWHSSLRLKMIEKDAHLGEEYEMMAKKDSQKIKYIISGCKYSSEIYRNSFWYNGKILEIGTPRIDYLINHSNNISLRINILEKLGLSSSEKYILYAPTFRKNDSFTAYDLDYEAVLSAVTNRFGGVWKLLVRFHPNLLDRVVLPDGTNKYIDVTRYNDMQELLCISDILITDYSSCMFDFAFLRKICLLYASDFSTYIQNERGLYFDLKDLPFSLSVSNNQLVNMILEFNEKSYYNGLDSFMMRLNSFERGNSCEQIYEQIIENEN